MPAARCASGYPFHSTGLPHLGQLARRCFYKNQRNRRNQIAAVAAMSVGGVFEEPGEPAEPGNKNDVLKDFLTIY